MLILPVTWLLFRKTIKKKFKVQLITLAVFILISGATYANEAAYEQRIARGVAELGGQNYTNAIESFNSALKEKPDGLQGKSVSRHCPKQDKGQR